MTASGHVWCNSASIIAFEAGDLFAGCSHTLWRITFRLRGSVTGVIGIRLVLRALFSPSAAVKAVVAGTAAERKKLHERHDAVAYTGRDRRTRIAAATVRTKFGSRSDCWSHIGELNSFGYSAPAETVPKVTRAREFTESSRGYCEIQYESLRPPAPDNPLTPRIREIRSRLCHSPRAKCSYPCS